MIRNSADIVSFDCFILGPGLSHDDDALSPHWYNLIIAMLFQPILVGIAFLYYLCMSYLESGKDPSKMNYRILKENTMSTFVISYLIVSPDVIKFALRSFACETVEGVSRL